MSHILVVDDDDLILKVAKSVLQKSGFAVSIAKDGHAALELLEQELFDMVITDANMPNGISGFILAANIRKNERINNIPIMFLTGRKDKTDVSRALECGADDYVVKPIDPDIFIAKVSALIDRKKASFSFAMTKLKASGTWNLDFEITAMSEQGIKISSNCFVPPNTKVRLDSELFESMAIKPPLVRVMNCTQVPGLAMFMIEVSFVGMSETDLSNIRRWVIANNRSESA